MKPLSKISIFLIILIVDLTFFIAMNQFFQESYESIITTMSFYTQASREVVKSLFVIAGFIVMLICVPMLLYLVYIEVKNAEKSV